LAPFASRTDRASNTARRHNSLLAVTEELCSAGIDFQIKHGGKQPLAKR
jgi:hypothetical protein